MTIFVHSLEDVAKIVVDSVEKAVDAVVAFAEKIGVLLMEFIEFSCSSSTGARSCAHTP